MSIRPVLSLISVFAMCGCASVASEGPGPDECTTGGPRAPKIKVVNINYMPDPMVVAPNSVCARPGDVLRFKLNGKPSEDVKVQSKVSGVVWLDGGGKNGSFYIVIPWNMNAETEQVFKYKVVYGTKVLDPEVRVKNNHN